MWAEIDEVGTLIIVPETPIEVFALGVWRDGQGLQEEGKYKMRIVGEIEERPE